MRNQFWILLLFVIIIQCKQSAETQSDLGSENIPDITTTDNPVQLDNLKAYLNKPLDFTMFRSVKGYNYNSGAYTPKNNYFKPDTVGFYYRFFLFQKPKNYDSDNWIEKFHEDGIRILTYMFGDKIDESSEMEIIEIKSRVADSALMESNFVDKGQNEIINEFGNNYFTFDSTINYYIENKLLVLMIDKNRVREFRYMKTNCSVDTILIKKLLVDYNWRE
jgi:hypothetical protein